MELFTEVKGYATYDNAVKKLKAVLGTGIDHYNWHIGVTPGGRFYPVVSKGPAAHHNDHVWLAHSGICVTA
jgi:hypothetical protein